MDTIMIKIARFILTIGAIFAAASIFDDAWRPQQRDTRGQAIAANDCLPSGAACDPAPPSILIVRPSSAGARMIGNLARNPFDVSPEGGASPAAGLGRAMAIAAIGKP